MFLLSCLMTVCFALPKLGTVYVELGSEVSSDPQDYLWGLSGSVKDAEIDVSEVNSHKVGTYRAYAKTWVVRYPFTVVVRDTASPEILPAEGQVYIAAGREYTPEDFVSEIRDASDISQTLLYYDDTAYKTIRFDSLGDEKAEIHATDVWGNESVLPVTFTVDDAPVIVAFDRHLPVGTDFDVSRAAAVDSVDGRLSERVMADMGDFDPKTAGTYPVTYTVTDNYGLETTKTVTLTVCDKKELAQYTDDITLTPADLSLLCEADYFGYQPLETEDYDATVALLEPTLVNLKRFFGNGSWGAGSGAVLDVTPEYVYFVSVEHVVKEISEDCRMTFFDGAVISTEFPYATSNRKNELAVFAVPTGEIPVDTLLWLRHVHIDSDIYSKLKTGDRIVAFAKHWNGGKTDKIGEMEVRRMTVSIHDDSFDFEDAFVESTNAIMRGMSGTAVTDYRGDLIGTASLMGPSSAGFSGDSAYHSRIDVLPEAMANLREKLGVSQEEDEALPESAGTR